MTFLMRIMQAKYECASYNQSVNYGSGIKWKSEAIYKKQFEISCHRYNSRYNSRLDKAQDKHRNYRCVNNSFECGGVSFEINNKTNGRYSQQVQEVNPNREPHEIGN